MRSMNKTHTTKNTWEESCGTKNARKTLKRSFKVKNTGGHAINKIGCS
jgi:hypothetical protein